VADPAFGAGAVSLSAAAGAPRPAFLAPVMWIVSVRFSSAVLLGVGMNPPSSMISLSVMLRFLISVAVSGGSVFSAGFPSLVFGGRMNPRAPRLVLAVISHS